jgi:CubicO group peptidase (beta-lactamase class C family)
LRNSGSIHADYGFGLSVAVRTSPGIASSIGSVGDFSWPGAFGSYWWGDPREELAVVWMTQTSFRAVFGDMAIRSVHHNVARLHEARAFVKSEDWPSNVVSIAEARAQRLQRRRHGLRGNGEGPRPWC